jgi:hypothetical protein
MSVCLTGCDCGFCQPPFTAACPNCGEDATWTSLREDWRSTSTCHCTCGTQEGAA